MAERHNLLLIEDNPGDTRLIWEMLTEESEIPFDLEYVDRLSIGLPRLAKGGIDLVLLDLMLPDSWGIESFEKVHGTAPDVPIVILTSLNDEVIAIQALQKGAQDYLVKGMADIHLLVRTIRYAIVRKKAEVALQESNRQLEETLSELNETKEKVENQERLRVLGDMASHIAHNFKKALSPILSFSEMLLMNPDKLEDKDNVKRFLLMMNTAAKDAVNVASRLSKFSRIKEEEPFQSLHLNKLVEQVITITESKWKDEAQAEGKRVVIESALKDTPPVSGRESELREVLIHLVLNSVDAITETGTITLSTRLKGREVSLEVKDSGRGMSEEERKHCVDPSYTSQFKSGFGLAVVSSIVHQHRGKLEIESEEGKGTSVRILLPVEEKKREGERKDDLSVETVSVSGERGSRILPL